MIRRGLPGQATLYFGIPLGFSPKTSEKSSLPLPLLSQPGVGSVASRSSMPWPVPPTLLPSRASATEAWQFGSVWPWAQYTVSAVPSLILDWYSLEPPPFPSRSRAPYHPVTPVSAPTLTLQFVSTIGLPVGSRQVESPSTIAHGIKLLVPEREPICAAALAGTALVVCPSTRPNTQLN